MFSTACFEKIGQSWGFPNKKLGMQENMAAFRYALGQATQVDILEEMRNIK
jgi:hypothetical protein